MSILVINDRKDREYRRWDAILTEEVPEMVEHLDLDTLVFVGQDQRTTSGPLVHNHPEIAFVLDGALTMETSSQEHYMEKGAIVIVPPWMYHRPIPVSEETQILWLAFTQTHLGAWVIKQTRGLANVEETLMGIDMINFPSGYHVVNSVIREIRDGDCHWFRIVQNELSTLMILIHRAITNKDRLLGDRDRNSRTDTLVLAAQAYIERNFDHDIAITDVAHYVALSPNYFANLFKKRTGETIGEYITAIRMKEAQRLLRDTDLMISEIAYKTGYKSPYYFSRVFRYIFNQPPRDYRDSFTEIEVAR